MILKNFEFIIEIPDDNSKRDKSNRATHALFPLTKITPCLFIFGTHVHLFRGTDLGQTPMYLSSIQKKIEPCQLTTETYELK